jgi:hypothetical protein
VKGDVHNGLELDRLPMPRRRAKLPLAESIHGILVEFFVQPANQLDAVDRAVAANYGVEDHFALHVFVDQRRRVFRVNLADR